MLKLKRNKDTMATPVEKGIFTSKAVATDAQLISGDKYLSFFVCELIMKSVVLMLC